MTSAQAGSGKDISIERLSAIYLELQAQGAHNINLVSPTHFTEQIAESLKMAKANGLPIPVVWNSGGYDSVEGLALVDGLVDIYMPDIKYMDAERSRRYSKAADYFAVASKAVKEMYRQAGPAVFDDEGIMTKGCSSATLCCPAARRIPLRFLTGLRQTWTGSNRRQPDEPIRALPREREIPGDQPQAHNAGIQARTGAFPAAGVHAWILPAAQLCRSRNMCRNSIWMAYNVIRGLVAAKIVAMPKYRCYNIKA